MEYITNEDKPTITIATQDNRDPKISADFVKSAIEQTHKIIDQISSFDVDIFSILGMRNLSAFVGEVFVTACVKESKGLFTKNPHQDGYPDLLLLDKKGKELFDSLKDFLRDKAPFSPFKSGGIEVKATCGTVPTETVLKKSNKTKPVVGETRLDVLKSYDWKAHHRKTNNLFALLWDFEKKSPRIRAIFYSSSLCEDDWGKIIEPKTGGGRTTSVSIMTRNGVAKLYKNWLIIEKNKKLMHFLDHYNSGTVFKNFY